MITETALTNFPPSHSYQPTFVGHLRASLQVHLAAPFGSDLVDLIAHIVTAILSAAQAEPFLKGFLGVAPVSLAWVFFIQQGVNKEMNGALMGALYQLVHVCPETWERVVLQRSPR